MPRSAVDGWGREKEWRGAVSGDSSAEVRLEFDLAMKHEHVWYIVIGVRFLFLFFFC